MLNVGARRVHACGLGWLSRLSEDKRASDCKSTPLRSQYAAAALHGPSAAALRGGGGRLPPHMGRAKCRPYSPLVPERWEKERGGGGEERGGPDEASHGEGKVQAVLLRLAEKVHRVHRQGHLSVFAGARARADSESNRDTEATPRRLACSSSSRPPLLGRTGTAFDPAGGPLSVEPACRRSEGHRRPRGFSVRSASPHSICLAGVSGCQFADQRPMVAGRNDPRVQQRGLRAPRWVRGFRPRHGSIAALCCVAEETRLSCTARRRRQSAMQETGAWGMGLHSPHEIARFRVAQHRSLSAPPRRVTRRRPNTTRQHRAAVTRP